MITCKSCKNNFKGNYCNNCGEKVVKGADFTLKKIFSQALDSITHLDSKLFKTLKLLFFYPGKLSQQFIEGIRNPYMKPFQIFIISNIVFFILFANEDVFKYPSPFFFKENFDGINVLEKVRQITAKTGMSQSEIADIYDIKSTNLAKGFLVFLIPIIALIAKLLNPKQHYEFGKHVIFSTHFFSFLLLLFVMMFFIASLVPESANPRVILVPLFIILYSYFSIAVKLFYSNSYKLSFIKGIIGIGSILFLFEMYKITISIVALYTI